MDFDALFQGQLDALKQEGNYRIFAELERKCGKFPRADRHGEDGKNEVTVWCSNDYLGMGQHPDVVRAMVETAEACGTGAGGTRNISGTNHHHRIARGRARRPAWQGSRASLLVGLRLELGGAVDAGLAPSGRGDPVGRAEPCEHDRGHPPRAVRQGDLAAQRSRGPRPQACGDSGRPAEDRGLRKRLFDGRRHRADPRDRRGVREAWRDDLHRRGARGRHVRPPRRRRGRTRRADGPDHPDRGDARQGLRRPSAATSPGPPRLCDFIRSFSSGFIFTTALPPAVAAAATASIRHLKVSQMERARQQRQVRRLRERLDARGIPHMDNPSHIIPVMIGDPVKCRMISDMLMADWGIYVQPINYPTVPKGTERLRITPSPLHTDADIEHLVTALESLWKRCAIARQVA